MTNFATMIKTAIAALMLSGGAALAEGTYCPATDQWVNPGQGCPAPQVPTHITNQADANAWLKNVVAQNMKNQNYNANQIGDVLATIGDVTATGGNANQQQGQQQGQSQTANASTGPINIDNSTRIRQAASSAAPALIQSTGNTLCDGGGSLSMTMQTFEWGVAVGGKKGDRFCQMVAVAGDKGGIAYLAHKDRAARAALIDIGLVVDGKEPAATVSIPVAKAPTCPVGSAWDGRGCYAANLKTVSR